MARKYSLKILVREGDHGLGKVSLATISGLDFEQGPVGDGFPGGSVGKESACNAGDTEDAGLIPGLERSPGGGQDNPLQYSCLDRGVWGPWVTKSQTQLKQLSMHTHIVYSI